LHLEGFGGAISNFTTDYGTASATIHDSRFERNVAEAGDAGEGAFAAIAGGGAIGNDSELTVVDSSFTRNKAIGGDSSTSPFHNGHSLGGAISTGSLTPGVHPTVAGGSLVVGEISFYHNVAEGGSENIVTLPLAAILRADAPNNA
jgi:hypothetical protein